MEVHLPCNCTYIYIYIFFFFTRDFQCMAVGDENVLRRVMLAHLAHFGCQLAHSGCHLTLKRSLNAHFGDRNEHDGMPKGTRDGGWRSQPSATHRRGCPPAQFGMLYIYIYMQTNPHMCCLCFVSRDVGGHPGLYKKQPLGETHTTHAKHFT